MKKHLLAFLLTALAVACAPKKEDGGDQAKPAQRMLFKPDHDFSPDLAPPAPDYRSPDAWAALPERNDNADQTPEGSEDMQAEAAADVFFIHPTTYFKKDGWNAPYSEGGEGPMSVDGGAMRAQASVFNGCCRVFAPRYRQATLFTFFAFDENSKGALDLAYRDIAAAFDDFIRERNDGRPFIIASHSQGSYHAMRLLKERVIGTDLMGRLVAVYAVGAPLPAAFAPDSLPPCADARQTRCIIGWNTISDKAGPDLRRNERALIWLDDRYEPVAGRPLLCVNPLNWKIDAAAPASDNLGALPGGQIPGVLSAPLPGVTGAKCENGYLVIAIDEDIDGFKSRQTENGSYHIFDYNLFYMNIRANAAGRVDAFLESR